MKKKFLFPLLLLTAGTLFAATSCDNEETSEPEKEPQGSETTTELLRKESISLNLYQKVWLNAEYDGEETIVWTVADPTIVLLEDGALTGLKEGKTTVTVTVGDVTDSIEVTVAGFAAENLSLEVAEPNFSLYKGDEKTMVISVCYDGTPISVNAAKTFKVSNEAVIAVDANGKITAKDYGKASISVFCTVNGTEISTTVNVSVVSTGRVEITQPSVQLYTLASYGGQTYENSVALTAKVYERDVEQADANVVWTLVDGQDIVTLSGNTLTAQNAGETTVTATYVDNDGETKTDTVTVVVDPITVGVNKTVELWKNEYVDGYPVDELGLDTAETVMGGYMSLSGGLKANIPFADGMYDVSSLSLGEMELYVQTRNVIYQMTVTIFERIYLNNENFESKLKNADGTTISGIFTLSENITLSEEWSNEAIFAGSLDGQGYTISGLNVADTSGLFKATENATIKNVALVDVTLGAESGAFAYTNQSGTTTFENVYVSLAAQKFSDAEVSEAAAEYVTAANRYKGGLIGYESGKDVTLVVKNAVVYMPETLTTACGFVYGYGNGGNVTTENCTFIGGNGQAVGVNTTTTTATVTDTNNSSVYCDAVAAHTTYKADWSEMQQTAYNANHEYVELGNAAFINYFKTATSQIIVLTEDVTLSSSYMKVKKTTFTGVLDGNGKKISGMTNAAKGAGGLTYTLNGSIKNVAIIGEGTTAKTGLIADVINENAYLENVYIEVTKNLVGSGSSGIVTRSLSKNAGLSLKDVVIYAHGTNIADTSEAVMGFANRLVTIKTENLVYIHPNENVTPMYERDGDTYVDSVGAAYFFQTGTTGFKGASAKADFDAAVADETVTLTDFIKSVMYPTNS